MELNIKTKYNIGDTAYELVGTSVFARKITCIHTYIKAEDSVSISYSYEGSSYSLVHEKDLYDSLDDIKNAITLVETESN